ncbi:hypothetical protein [Microbacterium sp.]|uniref:hypothetical protein n=1 Tax=Microbacterium sp. TaxID=51671 RepID=UPI0039E22C52
MITAAADTSPLADRTVRFLAEKTARGVRLLSALIGERPAPVALAGAVATDPAFRRRLAAALRADGDEAPATIVAPALDPLRGAALLAFEAAGIPWNDTRQVRLAASGR